MNAHRTASVLDEVYAERESQEAKWGEQNHPDGTGAAASVLDSLAVPFRHNSNRMLAQAATRRCDSMSNFGRCTYEAILTEEWAEALACDDPAELRAELVQVAAVAVAWIEAIDRRES